MGTICAWCRKILSDPGPWIRDDEQVRTRDSGEFNHGVCPDCFRDFFLEKEDASVTLSEAIVPEAESGPQ